MAIFKIYDCDFGFTYNSVNYDFDHVDDLTLENPERTRLIRGANASNKTGLVYKEGIKDAKTLTLSIIGVSVEIHNLLKQIYKDKERVDFYCVSRADGSSKIGKNAILSQEPLQLSISESADSKNMSLVFESYDVEEVHKS
jgi:hypothetical protein